MIDVDGYRPNVGIIISNQQGQLLWAKRIGQDAWQFPQGGMQKGENAEQAMYRELHEEVGLYPKDVEIIASTRGWLRYRLPKNLLRSRGRANFIGQKQSAMAAGFLCNNPGQNLFLISSIILSNCRPGFPDRLYQ